MPEIQQALSVGDMIDMAIPPRNSFHSLGGVVP
jgi:hypothetical protein